MPWPRREKEAAPSGGPGPPVRRGAGGAGPGSPGARRQPAGALVPAGGRAPPTAPPPPATGAPVPACPAAPPAFPQVGKSSDLLIRFFESDWFDCFIALTCAAPRRRAGAGARRRPPPQQRALSSNPTWCACRPRPRRYLHKSQSQGVHDYLCNRLYGLPERDLERYLPQLTQLTVARPGGLLERVLIDLCAQSLRIAAKVPRGPPPLLRGLPPAAARAAAAAAGAAACCCAGRRRCGGCRRCGGGCRCCICRCASAPRHRCRPPPQQTRINPAPRRRRTGCCWR